MPCKNKQSIKRFYCYCACPLDSFLYAPNGCHRCYPHIHSIAIVLCFYLLFHLFFRRLFAPPETPVCPLTLSFEATVSKVICLIFYLARNFENFLFDIETQSPKIIKFPYDREKQTNIIILISNCTLFRHGRTSKTVISSRNWVKSIF